MIFDLFLSSSTRKVRRSEEKRIAVSNATIKTTTTRTPPSIGFASSENLFSYVRLPVSKSVESICVVSEMCRENERTKREKRDQIQSISARALDRKKSPSYLSRLSRCLGSTSPWWWWCLFFLCVFFRFSVRKERAFLMSAPKAQTSRSRERDKKRERERDDDDDVSSLLCFCTQHEKTRDDPKKKRCLQRERRRRKKRSFFSPIYTMLCACV